jgi:hypothetical protein
VKRVELGTKLSARTALRLEVFGEGCKFTRDAVPVPSERVDLELGGVQRARPLARSFAQLGPLIGRFAKLNLEGAQRRRAGAVGAEGVDVPLERADRRACTLEFLIC